MAELPAVGQLTDRCDRSPFVHVSAGCTASCPLDKFIDLTRDEIPVDWQSECQSATTTSPILTTAVEAAAVDKYFGE